MTTSITGVLNMADGSLGTEVKSGNANAIDAPKAAPAYDPDKDYISTLLLELGRATAVVDLLYMVACGKAVDSVDAMGEGTLANSLDIALERLYAVKAAAEAILDEQTAARRSAREVPA
jgi:hypothetical protein